MSFNKTVLENGLRIITVPQKNNGLSATVLVLVEAGSKYENKSNSGVSHFLEHLCFKGTTNRPTAMAIAAELDDLGAEYNAFTDQEFTGYYAKVRSEQLDKAIDIISDLYANPLLDSKEIEKEKGVVIEEINMYEDITPRKAPELFDELLYGDQPAGWPIGGQKAVIRKLTREDIVNYRQQHYVAKATVIVVAGSFDEKDIIGKLQKAFAGVPATKKFGKVKTEEDQIKPAVKLKFKESDQTHLVLGCRAFDAYDERRFAIEVLNAILGGGMSSRLFQRIREDMGAAYYVRSGENLFSDHGYWAVGTGVDHQKVHEVIAAILDELRKIKTDKVEDKELRHAKDYLSGQLVLGLETSDAKTLFYGTQEVLKKPVLDPVETLNKIQSVTADDIFAAANEIFQDKNLNLALIGPFKNEEEFLKKLSL